MLVFFEDGSTTLCEMNLKEWLNVN
jgi:hypothetical protein